MRIIINFLQNFFVKKKWIILFLLASVFAFGNNIKVPEVSSDVKITQESKKYDHHVEVEIPEHTPLSKNESTENDFSLPISDPVIIFALVLCVMLFLPLIFAKLHVPGILGIIVAGIFLGPNGFNVLAKDSSVVLFGTVGIVYLMFFSGLEVDFNDFKRSSLKSLFFGVLTFILPQTLGTLGNMWILGMSLQPALLLASTYASHTLLTYPLISKLGVKKNEAVVIAIGGTIITNTASLIVLALTTVGEINSDVLLKITGNFIILCIVSWVIVPIIARLFFKYMDGDGVQHFLFVLGTVFTVATISQLLGIEPVIGAFLAGLGLNRYITEGSVLINRLEFTGNALFIPYFLLYVGMLVNPASFTQNKQTWAFAAVMTLTAMGTKWIAAHVTARAMKLSTTQGNLIFGLSNAQAANTLAAVLVGYRLDILNEQALNGTVVMILITCVVSAIASEKAAKEIVESDDVFAIDNENNRTERIFVPIANPENINTLIETAMLLKISESQIFPLSVITGTRDVTERKKQAENILTTAVSQCSASDQVAHLVTRVDVSIASGIVHSMLEHSGSSIVMGASVKNMFSGFFPTVLKNVLEGLQCSVVISRCTTNLNLISDVHVLIPRYTEHEIGFKNMIIAHISMCQKLKTKLFFYAYESTLKVVSNIFTNINASLPQNFVTISRDKDYRGNLPESLNENSLLLFVMTRSHSISYSSKYEKLAHELQQKNANISQIDYYPEVLSAEVKISKRSFKL